MAIILVVNHKTNTHGAMRSLLKYVLCCEKTKDGYVDISGPYPGDTINYDEVYRSWIDEKKLWSKDSGRMYAHYVISFHKDEKITPEQVLEIGWIHADRFFCGYQYVIAVHQDKKHLHCHIVINTVSWLDGKKLHQSKSDLEKQREFINQLCLSRGLSIAEKGKHFDGTAIETGGITAWDRNKYHLLADASKKSYVADCGAAIMEVVPQSASREEFISSMEERGWSVQWEDSRKHIVFRDRDGNKVRDTNIEKTFSGVKANKEDLDREFAKCTQFRATNT